MAEYLSAADFLASKWGAGLTEDEASVCVELANATIERLVDPAAYADMANAGTRAKAVALRVANAVRKNFDRNESVAIGGKLSVSFATEDEIERMARQGLGDLALQDEGGAVSVAELPER